ncbi:heparan-alpha-glucosaminide N-acetyltransferase domain-containing protein [Dethiobacter alkaliphilus]|uniref:Heparan-alpha-glucosaminide N-acetyltransferase catalytic domain-containing protein n=1 Tax=Dethiobacter alkaliphilus AHT 1 TaxID=555088 RepID=C0GHG6_DETAL|nr:heparan-alpha-glucosaminide N-acetyltransferase domain-containing protein [Dethiobacter alkaliphilus]EEG77172.1 hypothetical protein DealDRAFT_1925 [Dethiobacter alkaliphilus AHT 1]
MADLPMEKKTRFSEIDALRGLAVLLMVFNHGMEWAHTTAFDIVVILQTLSIGDIATPMFYFAAGLSLYLSLQTKLRKNPDPLLVRQRYTVRLGKLFAIGITVSLTWGVLQAQAVTLLSLVWLTMTLPKLKDLNPPRYFFPGLLAATLSLHFLITSNALHPAVERVFSGQFPLFAILSINIAGFYLASRLAHKSFTLQAIALATLLIGSGLVLRHNDAVFVRSGAPAAFLLFGIGLAILFLGIFRYAPVQRLSLFRYLTMMGKDALFVYVFHYALFFVPFFFTGLMGTLSATASVIFSGSMLVGISIMVKLREKNKVTVFAMLDMIVAGFWSYLSQISLPSLSQPKPRSARISNSGMWTDN